MDYKSESDTEKKIDPIDIWKQYENARDYKSSENMYEIIAQNEAYYAGDQWRGVKSGNLPTPVFNFIEQLVDVKVSTIMADHISIYRKPDEVSEMAGDEEVIEGVKVINLSDQKNWERLKMDNKNEEMLLDASISGAGITHWYWDSDIKAGNKHKTKGDFDGEIIDSINLYMANPNEVSIQAQDWIIISSRKTVKQVRAMAKNAGIPEEKIDTIRGDEEQIYEGYDKAQNEQAPDNGASGLQTILLKYWKQNGTVWCSKTTDNIVLKEATDTELEGYPLAKMNWKIRKRFAYGTAEITYIIKNQQHVNKMLAMQQLHATLQGMPKLLFNKTVIDGVSNTIGGIIPVRGNPSDNIANVMAYKQPAEMSIDVDKSINNAITLTREFKGVNDNVLGVSRAENTSALIAQRRAAGVPLESIYRRFLQYVEDVALIWLDFYKTKYNTTRKVYDEDGNESEFKGTDYKDLYLKTKIDVGATNQWSEMLTKETLDTSIELGIITPLQYMERQPHGLIPEQQKLIEEMRATQDKAEAQLEAEQQTQAQPAQEPPTEQAQPNDDDVLTQIYQSLPPEQQQAIGAMPEDEAKEALRQLASQQ